MLVAEQLAALDDDDGGGGGGGGGGGKGDEPYAGRARSRSPSPLRPRTSMQVQGVDSNTLYRKAVEEFICTSEMSFRTLLREFYDHQMIESRRDGLGVEVLWVPFRREELEALLLDLI